MSSHSVAESCGDVTQLDLGVDSVAPVRQSSAMDPTPESIAREYFARIRARNLDVSKLFCEDAVLLGLGDRVRGRQAIRDFYGAAIRDARPTPSEPVAFLVEGTRVFAEIHIKLGDDSTIHAVDVFEVEAGLIRSLTYFIADYPPD